MIPLLATADDATAESDGGGFEWGAALISIPDVGPIRPLPTPAERWEREWAEQARARAAARRPRRRVRREIRVAACLCLAFAPVATAVGAWGLAQPRRAGASEVAAAPAIRLSIKPVEAEPEARVSLPGYVLPAERREEPSHEGS
ncbi:hypothetical protein [Paludisphaera sp.]|uniref:hypothetical protein n=1 Tax=Paludisphaera sp. TaxID=2017432 RepID=UPI00301E1F3A